MFYILEFAAIKIGISRFSVSKCTYKHNKYFSVRFRIGPTCSVELDRNPKELFPPNTISDLSIDFHRHLKVFW
jgi:hypothetical protein